jgi:hypothetical protein
MQPQDKLCCPRSRRATFNCIEDVMLLSRLRRLNRAPNAEAMNKHHEGLNALMVLLDGV